MVRMVRRLAGSAWIVAAMMSGCAPRAAPGTSPIVEATPRTGSTFAVLPLSTPLCSGTPTIPQTEGPYYMVGAPDVSTLVDETTSGDRLLLTGQVMTTDCVPLADAILDIWQADASGAYDNVGYRMRGRVATDAEGRYALETVVPGPYPGRTPHIHVKVFDPDGRELLTTQIYLTGVSDQIADPIFDPALLARDLPADSAGRRVVAFDIVVRR